MYHCTKTYHKQQKLLSIRVTNYSTKYYIITRSDIVNVSKRNKKYEICYNNFALWKIEAVVDVKRQKQPPRVLLQFS